MGRTFLVLAAISGFTSVAAGAFGAHALKARLDAAALATFETAARYQMFHALALLGVALAVGLDGSPRSQRPLAAAGWLFLAGTVLFSGSLYALALGGVRGLGAITPLGGLAFLGGWAALAVAAWSR
jgi:uncharacterized membrane protein YgdD (TMEM256/DUF423 family)